MEQNHCTAKTGKMETADGAGSVQNRSLFPGRVEAAGNRRVHWLLQAYD